jgi:hypothetical protein
VRANGTGRATVLIVGDTYQTHLHRIRLTLAGVAADLRTEDIGPRSRCDIITARMQIDRLNSLKIGEHLSFEQAAASAVFFVGQQWEAIENIGLVLHDAGEVGRYEVALFGRCGQRCG